MKAKGLSSTCPLSLSMYSLVSFPRYADVSDYDGLARVILEHNITCIVHLATILSAIGNTRLERQR